MTTTFNEVARDDEQEIPVWDVVGDDLVPANFAAVMIQDALARSEYATRYGSQP